MDVTDLDRLLAESDRLLEEIDTVLYTALNTHKEFQS